MSKGRPAKTVPPVRFGCCLPQDLNERLQNHLHSEIEGRVPHGAKSIFIETLIRAYFAKLDGTHQEIEQVLE